MEKTKFDEKKFSELHDFEYKNGITQVELSANQKYVFLK